MSVDTCSCTNDAQRSVDSKGEEIGRSLTPVVAGIVIISSLGGLLFGLDIGYIGPIEGYNGFAGSVNGGKPLSEMQRGFVTGIFSIGALVGASPLLASFLNEGFGRRKSILCGSLLFSVGAFIQALASSIRQISAGRFIAGLSVGCLSCTVPMYQSEVAPFEWRGTLGTTYQLSVTFGILVSYIIDAFVNTEDNWGWRIAILFQLIPGLGLFSGMVFAPASPRWLVSRGQIKAAEDSLQKICGCEQRVKEQLEEIVKAVHNSKLENSVRCGVLQSSHSLRLIILGMVIMLLQQLVGMNAFMYYGTVIFEMFGEPKSITNIIMGSVNFVATLPGLMVIDHIGRTKLLLFSSIGMMFASIVCEVIGTLCHPFTISENVSFCGSVVVVVFPAVTGIFVASFAFGWGPVAWVYCAEMFPLEYRSTALSFTTSTNWAGNFLIAYLTPILLAEIKFHTFGIFAVICGLSALLSLWLPEPKGVSLENMHHLFKARLGANDYDVVAGSRNT